MEWKKCEGTCNSLITDAVNQEIGSTAFMLKLLADSVIRPDDAKHRLKIGLDPSFFQGDKGTAAEGSGCRVLTGRWKEDAPFLHLVLPPSKQGRLVMGFGPSASGKTHWAKTILGLLQKADDQFPEVFFAVDGGLVRESSAVYQCATEMAHCAGFAGFKNLHAGMFVTGDIKKEMEKYLLAESKRVSVSLYVPETLGKCEFMVRGVTVPLIRPCDHYLKTFMNITRDDKWIGLLIWQHATAADHGKDAAFSSPSVYAGDEYACVGCMASGKEREKGEGKPYEGHVYAQSMKNGRKYMERAPGGRYEIHNAGRRDGVSVLWDRSVRGVSDRFSEIMQASAEKYKIHYVDARMTSKTAIETGRVLGEFMKERRAKNETMKRNALRNANALRNTKRLISEFDKTRGETHYERAARLAASAAKSAAKSATRRSNAIARRTDPSFLSKVMAADAARAAERNAKRNALRSANASAAVVAQRQHSNAAAAQNQGLVRSSSSYSVVNAPPPDYNI
jgi:energy-coupling factor transporter ATP-binding protein EcfA2